MEKIYKGQIWKNVEDGKFVVIERLTSAGVVYSLDNTKWISYDEETVNRQEFLDNFYLVQQ